MRLLIVLMLFLSTPVFAEDGTKLIHMPDGSTMRCNCWGDSCRCY